MGSPDMDLLCSCVTGRCDWRNMPSTGYVQACCSTAATTRCLRRCLRGWNLRTTQVGSIRDITATEDREGTPQRAQTCGQTAPAGAMQGRLTALESRIHMYDEVP